MSFGNTPWGSNWGAGEDAVPLENIPTSRQWDIFDLSGVARPDDLERVATFVQVALVGSAEGFFPSSFNVASGGAYPATTAILAIDVAVTASFTVQYDVSFEALPPDFSGLSQDVPCGPHVYLGVWDANGYAAGFFISEEGWAYTGEVTIDSDGNIIPDQPVTQIPGSATWTQVGVEYVIRVVVDASAQLLYLFITPSASASAGQQLQAILVALPTISDIPSAAFVSVLGAPEAVSWVELFNYQLSSQALLLSVPPTANAGSDQTTLFCSIVQLDGSASFDPHGLALTYEWRLVDAPNGSMFLATGGDGQTFEEVPPTGFTDTFYSEDLVAIDALEPLQVGDVLTDNDGSFTIVNINRVNPFSVQVEYQDLPENISGTQFKVLRQNGINGATTVKPTFYPDVLAFFTFDLRVNNGSTSSSPQGTNRSRVLVNVLESALPKGCPIDASFLFDNLLSVWKQVEDRDRISVFWEALARVASTELYTLWQVEYSKSLRDIQRTFIRRWIHYDLLLPEPSPELTAVRFIWGGITSNALPSSGVSGVAGTRVVVGSPFLAAPVAVPLVGLGTVPPTAFAQELQARLREVLGPSVTATVWWTRPSVTSAPIGVLTYPDAVAGLTLTVSVDGVSATATVGTPSDLPSFLADLAAQLPAAVLTLTSAQGLRVGSPTVGSPAGAALSIDLGSTLLVSNGGPLTFASLTSAPAAYVHVTAAIPFVLLGTSTSPGFTYPCVNTLLGGTGGEALSAYAFRVSCSLSDSALLEDDLLVVNRQGYRVVRAVDDPSDDFAFQRLVVKDPLPPTVLGGASWVVPGWVDSTFLNFWAGLVDAGDPVDFELIVPVNGQNVITLVSTVALGANATQVNRLAVDTGLLAAQLSLQPGAFVRLARVLRRHFIPVDSRIVDIPTLSDVIAIVDTDEVLLRNVDYFLEAFRGQSALRFVSGVAPDVGDVFESERPPVRLWAEYTFFDNSDLIEANFGSAIGLTRDMVPATVDYLSAVRGIWYARYNGPTMQNLRIAMQIFLGLPFAEEAGTILEIRTDFFTQQSRILIQDTANAALVRSYVYPRVLGLETNSVTNALYAVGDTVTQFAPLVTGAEVVDYVKDPSWFQGILMQGVFYEVQKYHTFLIQVNSQAFNLASVVFAQQFIQSIKPKYTIPLYVVSMDAGASDGTNGDQIDVEDDVTMVLTLYLYDTPGDREGASIYFDEPWPSGARYNNESWRNYYDRGDDPTVALPVYPGPSAPVPWGFDKEWVCPADELEATQSAVFPGGTLPTYDSVFAYDQNLTSQEFATVLPPPAYPATVPLFIAPYGGTIQRASIQLNGPTQGGAALTQAAWVATLLVNGVAVAILPFTLGYTHPVNGFVVTLPQNIELTVALTAALNGGDAVALSIAPVSALEQVPGWTQIVATVFIERGAWAFDVPLAAGTYCSTGDVT
jgi:hypothetical protein